ncbi:EAL domain-containing protein [Oculatella sp. LEGE 06141]|uniref:bifunctional diguanylate cyclase/phosphodiesterase n=1 Tax=Oculatella sp. LEGE 06141 TaxID=1828648 RepID=UPI001881EA35|nr:EAL domain-containing protein [Oculatella sp. LEGE 06141]MBE9179570.1 EAL domain-containing protein [Oculatella sp. LEGE 06141]
MSYREHLLHQLTNRIRQSLELPEILATAVQEIRSFLEIDRVKIYRFDTDSSGEVIAESIDGTRLPSLLNLRFPAEDIPLHARELFLKARQRVIVDVGIQRRTLHLLDCPETGESLLVNDVRYAAVDPCHAQYLTAMGVVASLTVPILHQNQLWGLLVAHHSETHPFSERELQIVQLLIDQVSIAIAQANLLSQAWQQAHHEATVNQISSLLHCPLNIAQIRQGVLDAAVTALRGSGGRLYIVAEPTGEPAQLYVVGEQPTQSLIEEQHLWRQMARWYASTDAVELMQTELEETAPPNSVAVLFEQETRSLRETLLMQHQTDWNLHGSPCLYTLPFLRQHPQLYPIAAAFETTPIRAIAIIPLHFHNQFVGCLSIFRNGYDTEIVWAGRRDRDERNQRPRASFEAWRELKADQSPVWQVDEIKLAQSIGLHLYMSVTQKRVESMIRYQASHDALTNLPNRLLFDEQLSLALVNAKQRDEMVGVAFLDLDRFKAVNDTLGHATGDQLLRQVAERVQHCLREGDAIARWGGDEFTLLLPHLKSAEDVTRISQRILSRLNTPFWVEEQELYITASLGIALSPYDGDDAETLLKHADAAMYQAKQQGKNNYQLFSREMNHQALAKLALEADLRKALLKEEFELYYQPQVDITSQEITGLEALIRWHHPRLGFVSPGNFIPLAEETGLICEIGEWVLRAACQQQRLWRLAGLPPIRVAINLSARQFQQPNLINSMMQTIEQTKADPNYLEVEVTESVAMQDVPFSISVLKQLRQIGLQITMDDFGTGYSSLNSIKHFPLQTLKIDQSFVRDLVHSSSDAAIAKAVVALGKGLQLKVLAEGVETKEQLDFLQTIECDSAQGFFFSQPLPASKLTHLLSSCLVNPLRARSQPFSKFRYANHFLGYA